MPNEKIVFRVACLAILFSIFSLFVPLLISFGFSDSVEKSKPNISLNCNIASLDMLYYPNKHHLFSSSVNKEASDVRVRTEEEEINDYVYMICEWYPNVNPELVKSIIYEESRYKPEVSNGSHVGLMQISTVWHSKRAEKLGVTNLYDPYGNILVGIDYLNELLDSTDNNVPLSLMIYNMGSQTANRLYSRGIVSSYATNVLSRL